MSSPGQAPPPEHLPSTADLTFQKAEPLPAETTGERCVACKQPLPNTYYRVQTSKICPSCAGRIQSGTQGPPAISLLHSFLYGIAAAIGGCILYAIVSIITGWEFALMAIVVGWMVGKAIRSASKGLGGRPQQILAVVLTYFAISSSYIVVFVYDYAKNPHSVAQQQQASGDSSAPATAESGPREKPSLAGAMFYLLLLGAAAPFMALKSGLSGLISLFIIFIGLRQAWRLTGRPAILVMGPFEDSPA